VVDRIWKWLFENLRVADGIWILKKYIVIPAQAGIYHLSGNCTATLLNYVWSGVGFPPARE
jgi:hypothetical protein